MLLRLIHRNLFWIAAVIASTALWASAARAQEQAVDIRPVLQGSIAKAAARAGVEPVSAEQMWLFEAYCRSVYAINTAAGILACVDAWNEVEWQKPKAYHRDEYGGASGEWYSTDAFSDLWNFEKFCAEFKIKPGPVPGIVIVPTVPLPGGGALIKDRQYYQINRGRLYATTNIWWADTTFAGALYWTHNENLGRSGEAAPNQGWFGIYDFNSTGTTFYARTMPFYNNGNWFLNDNFVSAGLFNYTAVGCPAGGAVGSGFDFYQQYGPSGTGQCVWKDKGTPYAYPKEVGLSTSQAEGYPSAQLADYVGCEFTKGGIAETATAIWEAMHDWDSENVPPPVPVLPEDVVHCGATRPNFKGMAKQATGAGDYNCNGPIPAPEDPPEANPPPTSGGGDTPDPGYEAPPDVSGGGSGYNSDLTPPDIDFDFDWMPSLPELDFSAGATCPTYDITLLETDYVIDSHCPIIEQYRTLIAALMISVFTVWAVFIVLKA